MLTGLPLRMQASSPVLQAPTTMQPRAVLAFGPASSPSQHLRGGGSGSGVAFVPVWTAGCDCESHSRAKMCANPTDGSQQPMHMDASDLKAQMEAAIRDERYEDAAKIRDMIKVQGGSQGGSQGGTPEGTPEGMSAARQESASEMRERLRQREISRFRDIDTGGDNMGTPF